MAQRDEIRELRAELRRLRERVQMRPIVTAGNPPPEKTSNVIRQATHGLSVGNVIRHNGTIWTKSQADTAANAVVGGIVIAVLSTDVFVMATAGYVAGLSGLTAGAVHYLSAATAGALTTTAPTIAVPVLLADTTTSAVMMPAYAPASPAPFMYRASTPFTSVTGSGSITVGSNKYIYVSMIGAGGRAGNPTGPAAVDHYAALSSGGTTTRAIYLASRRDGGGGGGAVEAIIDVSALSSLTYTVGTIGGVTPAGSAGANGGDTTLTFGSESVTAEGGDGSNAAGGGGLGGEAYVTSVAGSAIRAISLRSGMAGGEAPDRLRYTATPATFYSFGASGHPCGLCSGSNSGVGEGTRTPTGGALFYELFT
jgi:hypothetical protein